MPLITDPSFYAAAVPAVLLLGISKSGFGVGFGSLAVPLMALAVPVPQAAAILMPVLLALDLAGLAALRRHMDRPLLRFLLCWGLPGSLAGALLFSLLDARVVAGVVGGFTLLMLAQRLLMPRLAGHGPLPRPLGRVLGLMSGLTSFVAHAGGPPLLAYVMPLRLSPVCFAATTGGYFFVINLAKWVPYGLLGLLDLRNLLTSLALMPLVPLGVFLGLRLGRHLSALWFTRLLYVGMALTGIKLLADALA